MLLRESFAMCVICPVPTRDSMYMFLKTHDKYLQYVVTKIVLIFGVALRLIITYLICLNSLWWANHLWFTPTWVALIKFLLSATRQPHIRGQSIYFESGKTERLNRNTVKYHIKYVRIAFNCRSFILSSLRHIFLSVYWKPGNYVYKM